MQIIMGTENAQAADTKYTTLPVDTFKFHNLEEPVTAYALVESNPYEEMSQVEEYKALHYKLMENFYKQNWDFCQQAIENLTGRWGNELDTFYIDLLERVVDHKETAPGEDWTGWLDR
jgi:hypothetical protein